MDDLSNLKRQEELKREAALGPAERWRMILAAIAWAESQPGVRRNTPAACLQHERLQLARLEGASPRCQGTRE